MKGCNFHYDTNINNAWVAFKLGGACAEGRIKPQTAYKFLDIIDKFKPKSNMFVIAGDYDDRFGETLTNLYRSQYVVVLEEYCKEKNISKDMARATLDDEKKAVMSAKALNAYVEKITTEEEKRIVSLTEIAECDIASDIYDGHIKGIEKGEKTLNNKTRLYLGLSQLAKGEENTL